MRRLPGPVRLALPAGVVVVLILGAMLVLLALMLSTLKDTSDSIARTNSQIQELRGQIAGLRDQVEPVADRTPEFLTRTRRFFRNAAPALETTEQSIPQVETAVARLAANAIPLLDDLRAVGTADAVATGGAAAADFLDLTRRHELGSLIDLLRATLVDARRRDLVRDADESFRDLNTIADRTDAVADILRGTLPVLCEMLEHLRSIDRKTGGQVPPDAADYGDGGEDDVRRPDACR